MTNETNEKVELLAAATLETLVHGQQRDYAGSVTQLYSNVSSGWPGQYDFADFVAALDVLDSVGVISRSVREVTSDYVRVQAGLALVKLDRGINGLPLLSEYVQFRRPWLEKMWLEVFPPNGLSQKAAEPPRPADSRRNDAIPAADRIVTLADNQFKEIDEPTEQLLEQLDHDNGIPDHPGLKERLTGQIRAGRELLKAGEFQLGIFQATMLAGLAELKDRYGDHAIGAAASALLSVILHVLGLPGF